MFSGLLRYAVCGGPYVIKSGRYYGCATNINSGRAVCANTRQVRRDVLETKLLQLIEREIFSREAIEYLTRRVNKALIVSQPSCFSSLQKDLEKTRRELEHVKTAIRKGALTPTTKAMLEEAEEEIAPLEAALDAPQVVTLIGEVTLKPNSQGLLAIVQGNLAGILDLSPEVCETTGAGSQASRLSKVCHIRIGWRPPPHLRRRTA